ncbi:hypothetical protein C7974DRAFT_380730 [Boeremia exigua]|uniref:uncharacterized protein n=1 Tax=Boeremia exigua TaxID=749465 RepID=UPI001E8DA1DC|nr:uncharacterized protein C7974DRAFT_380730 [Boeremia exigua]KAH6613022.1 hypothetical protein C7974DRAFT_380730 [Boeremia exigua]
MTEDDDVSRCKTARRHSVVDQNVELGSRSPRQPRQPEIRLNQHYTSKVSPEKAALTQEISCQRVENRWIQDGGADRSKFIADSGEGHCLETQSIGRQLGNNSVSGWANGDLEGEEEEHHERSRREDHRVARCGGADEAHNQRTQQHHALSYQARQAASERAYVWFLGSRNVLRSFRTVSDQFTVMNPSWMKKYVCGLKHVLSVHKRLLSWCVCGSGHVTEPGSSIR